MKLTKDLEWLKVYENALTKKECKDIIKFCEDKFYNHPLLTGRSSYRTSNQFWIPPNSDVDAKLKNIASKVAKLPINNQEQTSIIRYEKGQEYKEHWDYFHPNTPEHDKYVLNKGHGNRMATVLFYLSDNFEGGETFFKKDNILITPKIGMCVSWVNMFSSEEYNARSLHAGLPVKSGEKYIATKWIREKQFKI